MSNKNTQNTFNSRIWWSAFIIVAFIEVILAIKLLTEETSGGLLFAIIAVAILLIISTQIDKLVEITVKTGELSVKLQQAQRDIKEAKEEIEQTKEKIDKLFLLSLSPAMYKNLHKLSTGKFGYYEKSKPLERELYHLRNVGYIDVFAISQIPSRGDNLSDYVEITETGKEFVRLRELIEPDKNTETSN